MRVGPAHGELHQIFLALSTRIVVLIQIFFSAWASFLQREGAGFRMAIGRDSSKYTVKYPSDEKSGGGAGDTNNFGFRVRQARESCGLTQKNLAKAVGVSGTTIQNYESVQLPSGPQSVNLAKALGCSLDWLLLGKNAGTDAATPRGTEETPAPFHASSDARELEELRRDNRSLREDNQLLRRENAQLRKEILEAFRENLELAKHQAKHPYIHPGYEAAVGELSPENARNGKGEHPARSKSPRLSGGESPD